MASLIVTAVLAGCGAPSGSTSAPSAAPTSASTPSPTPTPTTKVEQNCTRTAPAGVPVEDLSLRSTGGVRLTGAVVGKGRRGVIMLHQTDDGICGWFPYALYLAERGFQALVFDRRCTGSSTCPTGDAAYRHLDDVRTGVEELRRRGAAKTVVVGASLGGSVAIGACAELAVAGCAALSPAVFDLFLGDGITATTAITDLRAPLLVAVSPDDGDSPEAEVRTLVARADPGAVDFVRLPAGAGHGWDTVDDPADPARRSPFSDVLVAFLSRRTA